MPYCLFSLQTGFALTSIQDRGVDKFMTQFGWAYWVIGLINIALYIATLTADSEPMKTALAGYIWLINRVLRYHMCSEFQSTFFEDGKRS